MPTTLCLSRRRPLPIAACLALVAALLAALVLSGCSGNNLHDRLRILQEKRQRIEAVRTDLLLAVNAEKSALLSPTQADAKADLATARQGMENLGKEMETLAGLIDKDGNAKEKAAFAAIDADFAEMARIDETLGGLIGRNTNLRAAMLSRTEAALAVSRLQHALTPVIDAPFCPASREALRIVTAALSILSLHAQHIDEATAAGMDALEAAMNRQDAKARAGFDHLAGLLPPDTQQEILPQSKAAYGDFWRATQEVIRLSRLNTNIQAQSLTVGRKRLLTAKTLSDLATLETLVGQGEFTATR
ncbi:hypothetical protein DesfrDRAFT_0113 [Solidesulfovibrio fructosivorans JJ]]|uniref:Uncharacterized protein n=1 Tax=Solidesulfovibrio fructosivorans JJ] TaxID=596151 RepID=E1JR64_SOLFR|nr:hypothetical protein [Solidesulfovibrio fructosivorans]EFL53065.1 hypothetical protein DesfrDRAFT_0113 [Solidesulfovibrio fructosivorans JJ]]